MNRLLNRLLAVKVDMQQGIFQYFTALMVGNALIWRQDNVSIGEAYRT